MKRIHWFALMTALALLASFVLPALAGGTDVPICIDKPKGKNGGSGSCQSTSQALDIVQVPVGRAASRAREPRGLFDFADVRAFIRAILGY
jgi:hypothetical protein